MNYTKIKLVNKTQVTVKVMNKQIETEAIDALNDVIDFVVDQRNQWINAATTEQEKKNLDKIKNLEVALVTALDMLNKIEWR